ncbi:hypothetical protein AMS59_05535 [Lysinibacillus sp. FJAT-14745]|uniref:hypothetical protein n=1 Tax=Lysinibacillus sp. FJAT-14745 TaxID=1704289 RepID=UPI0006ABBEE3|nr:hypothetical protein [Lysinibacillus sp. FJAT-14745]KOP80822.1 hypothetical protein AMS59_05535 [Lysinibacillus sp. FJAT-14745]
MERFELSFKNKAVRVWFYTVLPATILTIVLAIILPYEQNRYVSLGLSLVTILYFVWFVVYTKKKRK